MHETLKIGPQKSAEILIDFISSEQVSDLKSHSCPRCGEAMRYFDAIMWIDGVDSGRPVRLPFCSCPKLSTSTHDADAGTSTHVARNKA